MFKFLGLTLINFYEFVNLDIVQPRSELFMELPYFFPIITFVQLYYAILAYFCHFVHYLIPFSQRVTIRAIIKHLFCLMKGQLFFLLLIFIWVIHSKLIQIQTLNLFMKPAQKSRIKAQHSRQKKRAQKMAVSRANQINKIQPVLKIKKTNKSKSKISNEQSLKKQLKIYQKQAQQTSQQLTEHVNNLQDKSVKQIEKLQILIADAKQLDLLDSVRKQIYTQQKQQKQEPIQTSYYKDTGIEFNRGNYNIILKKISQQISSYNPKQNIYERINYQNLLNKSKRKTISTRQLLIRLNQTYQTLTLYRKGWERASRVINKINNQRQQMTNDQQQWYENYIIDVMGYQEDSIQYNKLVEQAHLFLPSVVQKRSQYLDDKQKYIRSHIKQNVLNLQKQKIQRISKYNDLINQKEQINLNQKKALLFLVEEAQQKINVLKGRAQEIIMNKESQIQKIKQQGISIINNQISIKNDLQMKLKSAINQIDKQQSFINQQNRLLKQKQKQIISVKNQQKALKNQNIKKQMTIQALYLKIDQLSNIINQQNIQIMDLRNIVIQLSSQKLIERTNYQKKIEEEQANIIKLIKSQEQINNINQKQIQQKFNKLIEQNKNQLLNEQKKAKQLKDHIRQLEIKHVKQFEQLRDLIKKEQQRKFIKINNDWSVSYQKLKLEYYTQYSKTMQLVKQKQKQFQTYKQNMIKQFQRQRQSLNIKLRIQEEKDQKKSQQIDRIKKIIKQTQEQLKKQDKLKTFLSQKVVNLESQRQNFNTEKNNYQQRIKNAQQKRREKQKQMQQYKENVINLLNEKDIKLNQFQQKLNKAQEDSLKKLRQMRDKQVKLNKYQELIQKITKQEKQSQNIRYLRWKNLSGDETIRLCFKTQSDIKWIPTIRGINYIDYQIIKEVFVYWNQINLNGTFPLIKVQKKIIGTNIIMTLDIYKNIKYFSLRQGYYNKGTFLPTRRGFNISQNQLNLFLRSVNQISSQELISKQQR